MFRIGTLTSRKDQDAAADMAAVGDIAAVEAAGTAACTVEEATAISASGAAAMAVADAGIHAVATGEGAEAEGNLPSTFFY